MTRRQTSPLRQEPMLDVEGFHDILGFFSAEPAGGHFFVLAPLSAVCLALRGDGVREEGSGSGFILEVGEVETEGLTTAVIQVENIGLDAATLSVEHAVAGITARLPGENVQLETGEATELHVGIHGPGAPDIVVEGEILLHVRRREKTLEVPLRIRAVSALIGPSPRFHCEGRPCPAEFDFGRIEARNLMDAEGELGKPFFFQCTVENVGGRSCALSASIEGGGFDLLLAGHDGNAAPDIPPGGSVDVVVKPVLVPMGRRYALLRLVVEGTRDGAAVVAVRLVADVYSSGPLFTLQPQKERVAAIRGRRSDLPITVTHLGNERGRITVFPVAGERVLKGTEIDLPAAEGSVPAIIQAPVTVQSEDLDLGEHMIGLATDNGLHGQLETAASVLLLVEDVDVKPAGLDFGLIPPGEESKRKLTVGTPSNLPVRVEVAEELTPVISVDETGKGHFVIRVNNAAKAPYEPRSHNGPGLKVIVPALELERDVPVSFGRSRPRLEVPKEIDFGSAPAGGKVSIDVTLKNIGDAELRVRVSSPDANVSFASMGKPVISAGAEERFSIVLRLPGDGPEVIPEGSVHTATIVVTTELPPESRRISVKGRVVHFLRRMCSVCKAVNEYHFQICWFCKASLEDAVSTPDDMIGQCPRCGSLFSREYTFCPKDGTDIVPFAESS